MVIDRPPLENALQDREARYRQMFENNRTVQFLLDLETGAIVDVNPAAASFYGYSRTALQQMTIADLAVLPDGQPIPSKAHRMLLVRGNFLFHHQLASREIRNVEINSSQLSHQGRQLLYCIVADITERVQAANALKRYHDQEQVIDAISQRVRHSLDLQEVLQTAVTEVQQFLRADRVMIYRLQPDNRDGVVLAESRSRTDPMDQEWIIHPAEQIHISSLAVQHQPPVEALSDIRQSHWPPTLVKRMQALGVRARLTIPIRQNEELWGLLVAHQCQDQRQWLSEEINLLKRLEVQLAVAIQQAELHQRVQQLNTELESKVQERTTQLEQALALESLLKRITDKVRDSLDERHILQTLVNELGQVLQLHSCHTSLYSRDRTHATIAYEYTQPHLPPLKGQILTIADDPEIYHQLQQDGYCSFCQVNPSPPELTAILVSPILDEQGNLGDLWLFRAGAALFTNLEIRLVQQVANQCAIALRQSYLYRAAQTQVQALERLNQLKDDFLSTVSHELRTPLSNINMATQLLEICLEQLGVLPMPEDAPSNSATRKVQQCLDILEMECDREIKLVSDMLTLVHLEAGTQPFVPSSIHLKHWIPQVIESFEEQAIAQQQSLRAELAPELPQLTTDLFMFNHILGELLTNACKFTPPGGTITVTASLVAPKEGKSPRVKKPAIPTKAASTKTAAAKTPASTQSPEPRLQVAVTNTGIDIPESEREAIFQQFYRIPSTNPWKYSGTGLGLALVKKMVTYLNGTIAVTSGKGQTTFTIELPLVSAHSSFLHLSHFSQEPNSPPLA